MVVNSIIKIESIVNVGAGRYYAVIPTLFIEVFGVIHWRLFNTWGCGGGLGGDSAQMVV